MKVIPYMATLVSGLIPILWAWDVQANFEAYKGLGGASVSSEVLAKFAPPSVPPEASRIVQAMLDVRAPDDVFVAPNGRVAFFNWRVTGIHQVWRVDRSTSFPVQLTGGMDRSQVVGVAPNGEFILVSRDRDGEENPGLYRQAVSGGPLQEIQHKPKVRTGFQFVSADSRRVYFNANDVKENSFALYRADLASGTKELIFSQDGIWEIADHADEKEFLLVKFTGNQSREYYLWKPGEANPRPLVGVNETEKYDVRFSARKGEFLVRTAKFGDFQRLYRFKDGSYTPISADEKWDVSAFQIDPSRRRIAYETNVNGYAKLAVLDARTFNPLRLPKLPRADHVALGHFSPDGRFQTIEVELPREPRRSYVIDWATGKMDRRVLSSAPEADLDQFVQATLESYPAADGTKIPMFVRRPRACSPQPCPVIVQFHGGPEGQSRPHFSPIIQMFVNAGFVWVEPNVRGSNGYGKAWLDADNGGSRLAVISDISDCARFIKRAWAEDGRAPKIGAYGGSYGGYAVQMAMTRFAGDYDAGFSSVGISSLLTFLKNTAPYRRVLRITEYGDPDKDAEILRQLSPVTYIDRLAAPLFLIQGLNDPRVPVGEAVQLHEVLSAKGIPSQLVIFPDEGHGSAKRENQVRQWAYALEFFQKHLKPLGKGS